MTQQIKKRLRKPASEVLDEAIWLWFCQEREKGTPLSGPLIKAKATSLHSALNAEGDFHASEGWLHRWKKRHGIQQFTISGEKLSADQEAATAFIDLFRNILVNEELSTEQVYNLDETGLNFKMLPNKTLAAKNNKNIVGYKLAKERLTLALCSNGSGTHKLPLFVIGKSRKPRAFKNISNLSALPVHYRVQKSAWMDRELFSEWFNNVFVPEVANYLKNKNLPQKAILLLDNAPSHPTDLKKNELQLGKSFRHTHWKKLCPNINDDQTAEVQENEHSVVQFMHDWEYLNSSSSIETPDQPVENEEDDDDEDNADTPACSRKINHSEAVDAFETALRYAEQQTVTKPVDIIFLKKWRDYASMKRRSCVKQTKIDSCWYRNSFEVVGTAGFIEAVEDNKKVCLTDPNKCTQSKDQFSMQKVKTYENTQNDFQTIFPDYRAPQKKDSYGGPYFQSSEELDCLPAGIY
ncbi:jerky protein homolog-like [Halyomorpha halys]|uniref:jerky protein homolog-like n=1 Tax=Halyomorpha halys TaxID=286706 RepID=UPI0034D35B8E